MMMVIFYINTKNMISIPENKENKLTIIRELEK